jgi:hypothetical protein
MKSRSFVLLTVACSVSASIAVSSSIMSAGDARGVRGLSIRPQQERHVAERLPLCAKNEKDTDLCVSKQELVQIILLAAGEAAQRK